MTAHRNPAPQPSDGESTAEVTVRVGIAADADIVHARQRGRRLASRLGFSSSELTLIATAISELARNILVYARRGEIRMRLVDRAGRSGISIEAIDEGPGIHDLRLALQDGYSTSRSLGLGLPGVKRLMDEFDIQSAPGKGTHVTVRKWAGRNSNLALP